MSYQTAFQLGYDDAFNRGTYHNPYTPDSAEYEGYGNGNVCGFEDLWIDQDHYSRGDYYGY